jgi:Rieske Fe-S protein
MNRKEFIKVCGGSCLAVVGISLLTQNCKSTHYVQAAADNDKLEVSKSDFMIMKNGEQSFRRSIIVKSDKLDYPLVVYRNDENNYTALLLRCTHQGLELNVAGDLITCSAHGSEFGKTGEIITGPAEQRLRSFPVMTDEKNIYIKLI